MKCTQRTVSGLYASQVHTIDAPARYDSIMRRETPHLDGQTRLGWLQFFVCVCVCAGFIPLIVDSSSGLIFKFPLASFVSALCPPR